MRKQKQMQKSPCFTERPSKGGTEPQYRPGFQHTCLNNMIVLIVPRVSTLLSEHKRD